MAERIWVQIAPGRQKLVDPSEVPEAAPTRAAPGTWHNHLSNSIGVLPSQVADEIAFNKAHGVRPTEYVDGRPKFNSARHQAEYCRARGWHNKDGVMG